MLYKRQISSFVDKLIQSPILLLLFYLLALLIVERDVDVSKYNCGIISYFSSISFSFIYFETLLLSAI